MQRRAVLFTLMLVLSLALALTPVMAQEDPLLIWADELSAEIMREIGAEFEEEFGVTVEIQQIPFNDIRGQFVDTAASGTGPDIIMGAHDWLGELATDGLLSPIDLGPLADDFNPNTIDAMTYNGEVYGVPFSLENTALFRNVDLVPEAPETWDEVRGIAEELSEDDIFGYVIQQRDPWHSYTVVSAFGGYVFDFEEGVGYDACDVGLDTEGTIAAYEFLGNLADDGLMPLGLNQESMWALFTEGEAAMMITGPWALTTVRESDIDFAVSAAPMGPGGNPRPFLSVRGFMVSAFADDPTVAQIFLTDFIATDETMQMLHDASSRPPAWLGVTVEDETLAAFAEAGEFGAPQPAIPEMNNVWESWSNQMELTLADPSSAESEATNAAEQVRSSIDDCEVEAEATEEPSS